MSTKAKINLAGPDGSKVGLLFCFSCLHFFSAESKRESGKTVHSTAKSKRSPHSPLLDKLRRESSEREQEGQGWRREACWAEDEESEGWPHPARLFILRNLPILSFTVLPVGYNFLTHP